MKYPQMARPVSRLLMQHPSRRVMMMFCAWIEGKGIFFIVQGCDMDPVESMSHALLITLFHSKFSYAAATRSDLFAGKGL
jgi:hypothetical protein